MQQASIVLTQQQPRKEKEWRNNLISFGSSGETIEERASVVSVVCHHNPKRSKQTLSIQGGETTEASRHLSSSSSTTTYLSLPIDASFCRLVPSEMLLRDLMRKRCTQIVHLPVFILSERSIAESLLNLQMEVPEDSSFSLRNHSSVKIQSSGANEDSSVTQEQIQHSQMKTSRQDTKNPPPTDGQEIPFEHSFLSVGIANSKCPAVSSWARKQKRNHGVCNALSGDVISIWLRVV